MAEGMRSLMKGRPGLFAEMVARVVVATILVVNVDAFLKVFVTPVLVATGIGAAVAPVAFFMGQALQPIIHSFCFFHFDDRFVLASLEATGAKGRLAPRAGWHKVGIVEKVFVRYGVMKLMAGAFVGLTGIFALVPILGPILTALVAGWAVAWDTVYVPLSGMGYVGVFKQGRSVFSNFRAYYWFGFWAVLIEEIPIIGPSCHVYNVYSAANFLERVYMSNLNAPADEADSKEL